MRFFFGIILILLPAAGTAAVTAETCKPFYEALGAVPHESIFQREGVYNSRWFETTAKGCFLVMNTSEERLAGEDIPDFSAAPGTFLYDSGWQPNSKYTADGPGSNVTGVEKDKKLCLIYYDQPGYRNDDGSIVQQTYIKIRVECMLGSKGEKPVLLIREADKQKN